MKEKHKSVDEYIQAFPEKVQELLRQMRKTIRVNAPGADEGIAYGMPAYKLNKKPLVYFAAFKSHIGFYATPSGHEAFAVSLARYKKGKGSVRFPLDKPLPLDLISNIVKFRVAENSHSSK